MGKDKKKNTAALLASAKDPTQPVIEEPKEEVVTITPTMMDASDTGVSSKKVDLSAIVPTGPVEGTKPEEQTEASMFLESKDKTLKTDGVVVIGTINDEIASAVPGASFPAQIDMDERRKKQQDTLKGKRKTKKVTTISDEQKKSQTITSIIVLALICLMAGAVYYILHRKTEKDFMPLTVTVELGDELPIRTSSYVKPGLGKSVNEMQYVLDKSQVNEDIVGEYPFTVTYHGITKTGKVIVRDTTKPDLKVKDVIITEGTSYTAETFAADCFDWSGCSYSFQDEKTLEKCREAGEYDVYIVASDPYDNKETKKAKLTIEEQGMVKKYVKHNEFNNDLGYALKTTYDLHFTGFRDESILLRGYEIREYTYQDEAKYNAAVEANRGNKGWTFDDANKTITYTSEAMNTIERYTRMGQLLQYLQEQGYTEV